MAESKVRVDLVKDLKKLFLINIFTAHLDFRLALLTTLLLWLEFHYRMLGFLEKVLTDFALHGLPW